LEEIFIAWDTTTASLDRFDDYSGERIFG